MVRTEQESNRKRREAADLLVLPRLAMSVQNGAGFSREAGVYWAFRKVESSLGAKEKAVGKCTRATFPKEKGTEPSVQNIKSLEERESR